MNNYERLDSTEILINKALFGIKATHDKSKEIYNIIYDLEPKEFSLLSMQDSIKANLLKLTVYSSLCEELLTKSKEDFKTLRKTAFNSKPTIKPFSQSTNSVEELTQNSETKLFVDKNGKLTYKPLP